MGGLHLCLADVVSVLISFLGVFHNSSASIAGCDLCEVSVVIPLHFEIKHFTLCVTGLCNEELVEETQDILADIAKLAFHLLSILFGHLLLSLRTFSFLFNRGDNPPRGAPRSNHVLVSHAQEIALFVGEFDSRLSHGV